MPTWKIDVKLEPSIPAPRVSGAGGLHQTSDPSIVLIGDVRLDNAQELRRLLGLPNSASLADILVHAYRQKGEDFPSYLLGEFSIALLDRGKRLLWLIRDHMGICPLYYRFGNGRCVASNSLDALLDLDGREAALVSQVVAEWCMTGRVHNQQETFYAGVHKVPRATALQVTPLSIGSRRYWSPDQVRPLVYTNERDYVEHLQDLLTQSVMMRLPEASLAAAHSSGGLDSTPVAVMAGRACLDRGHRFQTYNWCKPNHPLESSHEWEDAALVSRQEGFDHLETGLSAEGIKKAFLTHDVSRDGTAMFLYEAAVLVHARDAGVNTIFSGFGGDEIATMRGREWHGPAMRQGQWAAVWRRLLLEKNPKRIGSSLMALARFARLPLQVLGEKTSQTSPANRAWEEGLALHMRLLRPDVFVQHSVRSPYSNARQTIVEQQGAMMDRGYHQERIESWACLGNRAGVRYVYPLLDKRLVEFAFALPSEWYFRHGEDRYLYRRAVVNLLPASLVRKGKPQERHRVTRLVRETLKVLADPEIHEFIASAESPYVNTAVLLDTCRQARAIDPDQLQRSAPFVKAMMTAILALNINRKR